MVVTASSARALSHPALCTPFRLPLPPPTNVRCGSRGHSAHGSLALQQGPASLVLVHSLRPGLLGGLVLPSARTCASQIPVLTLQLFLTAGL